MVIRPFMSFPLPPLKFRTVGFPQYGFKQAVRSALHHRGDFDVSTVAFSPVRVLFRSRTCVRRHSRFLTPHTCPVALGSANGCIVRRPLRLLWPHPSFCLPPRGFMPAVLWPTEVPQFTLLKLDSVPPPLLRWFPLADYESARRIWPSPFL